ncbi:MAG: IPExxxVDY family protein [Marinilabiliales bacterium]|nr:MAG: IPExxxVDY family protein [Marinilabiliales bacterium]
MAKKKIHKLLLDDEGDFTLIGIASHENDYRLSWAINKFIKLELVKCEDLKINHPKHNIEINYSMYNYSDMNNYINYDLISNKSEKGFLLPELKNIDFILRVSGYSDIDYLSKLLIRLKKIDIVITEFKIDTIPERQKKLFAF